MLANVLLRTQVKNQLLIAATVSLIANAPGALARIRQRRHLPPIRHVIRSAIVP